MAASRFVQALAPGGRVRPNPIATTARLWSRKATTASQRTPSWSIQSASADAAKDDVARLANSPRRPLTLEDLLK